MGEGEPPQAVRLAVGADALDSRRMESAGDESGLPPINGPGQRPPLEHVQGGLERRDVPVDPALEAAVVTWTPDDGDPS